MGRAEYEVGTAVEYARGAVGADGAVAVARADENLWFPRKTGEGDRRWWSGWVAVTRLRGGEGDRFGAGELAAKGREGISSKVEAQ